MEKQGFGSLVVEFNNEIAEMERILSTVRRRGFELISMCASASNVDSKSVITLILKNKSGTTKSFVGLKKQLEKHIDVLSVMVV